MPGAVGQLERFEGLDRYVRAHGESGGRAAGRGEQATAEVGLWMLLEDVFAEQTDFELRAERVESALERLYRCVVAETGDAAVVATLHGMTISLSRAPAQQRRCESHNPAPSRAAR